MNNIIAFVLSFFPSFVELSVMSPEFSLGLPHNDGRRTHDLDHGKDGGGKRLMSRHAYSGAAQAIWLRLMITTLPGLPSMDAS